MSPPPPGEPHLASCSECLLNILGCIQKIPDWPPGAKTANGKALCHYATRCSCIAIFVSQSSEFCRYNPLSCFSTSVCCLFLYRLSPETFGYSLVFATNVHVCSVRNLKTRHAGDKNWPTFIRAWACIQIWSSLSSKKVNLCEQTCVWSKGYSQWLSVLMLVNVHISVLCNVGLHNSK
jgi:hypothetical protein